MPTPLSIALQAGLVVVLRELAECEADAAAWGVSACPAAVEARYALRLARRNAALMVCACRVRGVELGAGA